ncbi:MAG: DUF2252 family protein [Methylococcales bacterium]|nr:DUF2252 family protein [Methylococcales bacterium]
MKNILSSSSEYGREAVVLKEINNWNHKIFIRNKKDKYLKMAYSPFIFFRGTAHLFWSGFSGDWRLNKFGDADTRTWVQGDNHVENFGAFLNAKKELVYGLNDFDESVVADYQHDLWRMAVSIVLVLKQNKNLSKIERENVINTFTKAYLKTLCSYRDLKDKDLNKIYFTEHNTKGILKKFLKETRKNNSYDKMLKKWLSSSKKANTFNLNLSKLDYVSQDEYSDIKAAMVSYGRTLTGGIKYNNDFFSLKDAARRLDAGTGSLGTSRYYILIEDKTKSVDDDRILDIKHQGKPTPYYYFNEAEKINYDRNIENDAQRHAEAYKALSHDADDFLGWMKLSDGYYSVRERSPFKETLPSDRLKTEKEFIEMAKQWAIVLATGHEHASRCLYHPLAKNVYALTKGRNKEFLETVREVAFDYADQVERDWHYFVDALALTSVDLKRQKGLL